MDDSYTYQIQSALFKPFIFCPLPLKPCTYSVGYADKYKMEIKVGEDGWSVPYGKIGRFLLLLFCSASFYAKKDEKDIEIKTTLSKLCSLFSLFNKESCDEKEMKKMLNCFSSSFFCFTNQNYSDEDWDRWRENDFFIRPILDHCAFLQKIVVRKRLNKEDLYTLKVSSGLSLLSSLYSFSLNFNVYSSFDDCESMDLFAWYKCKMAGAKENGKKGILFKKCNISHIPLLYRGNMNWKKLCDMCSAMSEKWYLDCDMKVGKEGITLLENEISTLLNVKKIPLSKLAYYKDQKLKDIEQGGNYYGF